ncbi:MAG: metal-dependent hydrolase [Thiotrichaceae bacterium]|nr:metal-dependent hydrolase [Thiotrichaceae bacterium]
MPFTPLHMGSGIFLKAILQGSFSLMVFGWSQIVMDLQPLWVLLNGSGHLHGFSHTFIGGSLLAVISALSGKYLSEFGLTILKISKVSQPVKISWLVAFISAFVGCFSHIILDGIMHSDVQPFYPITLNNPMLGYVSVASLHKFCLYTGLLGAAIFYAVQWRSHKPDNALKQDK